MSKLPLTHSTAQLPQIVPMKLIWPLCGGLVGAFLIAGIAWLLGSVSVAGLRAQRRKERKGLTLLPTRGVFCVTRRQLESRSKTIRFGRLSRGRFQFAE